MNRIPVKVVKTANAVARAGLKPNAVGAKAGESAVGAAAGEATVGKLRSTDGLVPAYNQKERLLQFVNRYAPKDDITKPLSLMYLI